MRSIRSGYGDRTARRTMITLALNDDLYNSPLSTVVIGAPSRGRSQRAREPLFI
jgi:hypothetical protein